MSLGTVSSTSYRRWAFETAPAFLVTLCLWAKLVYFSVLLRAGWLLREESVVQWCSLSMCGPRADTHGPR
jgi:hypothetical protein